MKTHSLNKLLSRTILPVALLSWGSLSAALSSLPTRADTSAPVKVSTPNTAAAALDTLIGKPQIVGITEKNGTMFLGRVLSGDHTHYTVQAFHFAGPPQTQTHTYGTGRSRHTTHIQTQTFIPDVQAVELLVAGVAGSRLNPRELPTASGIISVSNVKCLQALSPPAKPTKKKKSSASMTQTTAALPAASVPPVAAASPAVSPWAWTITTLWPPAAKK